MTLLLILLAAGTGSDRRSDRRSDSGSDSRSDSRSCSYNTTQNILTKKSLSTLYSQRTAKKKVNNNSEQIL